MPDLTPPRLDCAEGVRLTMDAYRQDFPARRRQTEGRDHFKLERLQHFEEVDASREALRRGDWAEALRLLEDDRPGVTAAAEADARRGSVFRRIRIVEEPLSACMQWQLHSLRQRDECGVRVRIVTAKKLRNAERAAELPELVLLGGHTLYRVCYTDTGASDGAVRFTDPEVVASWEAYLKRLNEAAEDVQTYFTREVAR